MTSRNLALASLAALSLAATAQQPAPAPSFKGKVKPGLYEQKIDVDMGNMPGVPAAQKKQSTTRQQCVTDAEVDKLAEESNPACKTTDFRMTATGASFKVTCTGNPSMTSTVTMAFTATGYVTESKATMKPPGASEAVTVSQRSASKFLGPCPAPSSPAPKK
jgi:Protein of unknown function (DUF3617)